VEHKYSCKKKNVEYNKIKKKEHTQIKSIKIIILTMSTKPNTIDYPLQGIV